MEKRGSQTALDWAVFFLADVETGAGAFMAGYFTAIRHWNPEQIGVVLAAQKIVSVVTQASTGWLIDRSTHKRAWLAIAALAVAFGSAFVVWSRGVPSQIGNQIAVGAATAIASLTIPALSLGLVGRDALSRRLGRNGAFSHGGNMMTASLAGFTASRFGQEWIFYISALLGLACVASTLAIRRNDVDNQIAREAPDRARKKEKLPAGKTLVRLLADRRVLAFGSAVVLFHLANSPLLALAGEEISRGHPERSLYLTLCIVIPQIVMVPVSVATGHGANHFGRKPLFALAFLALIARGALFGLIHTPNAVVIVQALDGIGTGIAGVVTVVIVADLARGTGQFNALGGIMQSCLGLGAFLGNVLAGMVAKRFGFSLAFEALAVVATVGMGLFWAAMPETK